MVATRVDLDRRRIVRSRRQPTWRVHPYKGVGHERFVAERQGTVGVPEAPGAIDFAVFGPGCDPRNKPRRGRVRRKKAAPFLGDGTALETDREAVCRHADEHPCGKKNSGVATLD